MILPSTAALAAAAPWALLPAYAAWRGLDSTSLDDTSADPGIDAPFVSVIVPARNEARNIERCVRSILAANYPALELIVVDDHSSDGTGQLASVAGYGDARLRVIVPEVLPRGWFGKQWACWSGARTARGEVLLFADADTKQAPDLIARMVRVLRDERFAMLSVGGQQEMLTFWERVALPHPFLLLLLRFGGMNTIERARRPLGGLANGQCLMVTRTDYDESGGHAAVCDNVAEDLRMAQRFIGQGRRVGIRLGLRQLSTRMYSSLGELLAGWGKNVYAGGRYMVPDRAWMRPLFGLSLVLVPLAIQAPLIALIVAAFGIGPEWLGNAGMIALVAQTLWATAAYWLLDIPAWYGLLHPLGSFIMAGIGLGAWIRGDRVAWKGRAYVSR